MKKNIAGKVHATRNRLTFFSNTTFYRKSHDLIIVCNGMCSPINFKYKLYFKKELHFHYNNVYCLNFFMKLRNNFTEFTIYAKEYLRKFYFTP